MTPSSSSEARKRHEAQPTRWRVVCADGDQHYSAEAKMTHQMVVDLAHQLAHWSCAPHTVEEVTP